MKRVAGWMMIAVLAAALPASATLVAWYTFDGETPLENKANEGTFNLVVNDGTPTYTTVGLPTGVTGSAVVFNGATGLRSGSTSDFGTTLEKPILKVSFWIKHDGTARSFPFSLTQDTGADPGKRWEVDAYLNDNETYRWSHVHDNSPVNYWGSTPLTNSVWTKIAFEYDSRTREVTHFSNDVQVGDTVTLAEDRSIGGMLTLGYRGRDSSPFYLTGEMADVRVELIPEPATIGMLMMAMVGIVGFRRWFRR